MAGSKYSGYLFELRMWAVALTDLEIDSFYDGDCWNDLIWDTWDGCAEICGGEQQLRNNECTDVDTTAPLHVKWLFETVS